jgi:hypothetical protein
MEPLWASERGLLRQITCREQPTDGITPGTRPSNAPKPVAALSFRRYNAPTTADVNLCVPVRLTNGYAAEAPRACLTSLVKSNEWRPKPC